MLDENEQSDALADRIDAIEDAYEFMLAYAAQGRSGEDSTGPSANIRQYLEGAVAALDGLAAEFGARASGSKGDIVEQYQAFLDVLEEDSNKARAAVRLVLAQPKLSSQLIDNLNASIHLRALLTDVFLVDEIAKDSQKT